MQFKIVLLALIGAQAVKLQKSDLAKDPSTGQIVPICNGTNSHNCMEPGDMNKNRNN